MISAEDNRDSYKRVQSLIATLKLENNRHKLRSETDYADLSDVKDASWDYVLVDGSNLEVFMRAAGHIRKTT